MCVCNFMDIIYQNTILYAIQLPIYKWSRYYVHIMTNKKVTGTQRHILTCLCSTCILKILLVAILKTQEITVCDQKQSGMSNMFKDRENINKTHSIQKKPGWGKFCESLSGLWVGWDLHLCWEVDDNCLFLHYYCRDRLRREIWI